MFFINLPRYQPHYFKNILLRTNHETEFLLGISVINYDFQLVYNPSLNEEKQNQCNISMRERERQVR